MDRLKSIKQIRSNLKKGLVSLGTWMQIPSTSIAEILGNSSYDWIVIDMEHGSFANHNLPDFIRAIELGNSLPMVRLNAPDPTQCKLALDAGAGGVILPMIKTAEQLHELILSCKWPPSGYRGVGFSRANMFGRHFNSYQEEAQNPLVVAMIEHFEAVDALDQILSIQGLDAILIGPYDLSASINNAGEFNHPEFLDMISRILDKCSDYKIPAGIHVVQPSVSDLNSKINAGFQFIAYSMDSVFLTSSSNAPSLE